MTTQEISINIGSEIGVALDMNGCPNRCRHCYIGPQHPGKMSEEDLRWAAAQFRSYKRPGEQAPLWEKVHIGSWVFEPDCSPDYRRLYELENELSGLPSLRPRNELLSAWRLARDPEYAAWAHSIGVRVCQLNFFGLEEATDWGCRRKGAFKGLLTATERLLAVGIRPRWQLMFTKRILPDLPGLIKLAEDLRLRERCEALGGGFRFFMHCPGPCGEAKHIEHLRPEIEDLEHVPEWLCKKGDYRTEAELLPELLQDDRPYMQTLRDFGGPCPFLFVAPSFDVYTSREDMSPPWRLGNLKQDSLDVIVDNLANCRTIGLQALFRVPISELAARFGRPDSRRIYIHDDLKERWVNIWADQTAGADISWVNR